MEWYLPITILPAVALLILSTSNQMINLNEELVNLEKEKERYNEIIHLKLNQLKRLSIAIAMQYVSVLIFLAAGIVKATFPEANLMQTFLLIGVMILGLSIVLLCIYAVKGVYIRQKHLRI
ncbi:hypothetical protein [Marivirga sp.]|uniref:hypothetical protein n=1 Tax=Marivirga sp. TaxID=2018662 RepID=UPI003DA70BD3